jgi:chorismate-pyruvate lyase
LSLPGASHSSRPGAQPCSTPIAASAPEPDTQEGGRLFPLDEFYAQAGLPLPKVDFIPGDQVPEPCRSLLVHMRDMTPTLEDFYASDIHLQILRRQQRGEYYYREVVLRLDGSNLPVEFGANKISLQLFSPELRRLILEEHIPLGHLLKVHQVPHTNRPQAFLRVEPDDLINRSMGLPPCHTLYGRRNTLWAPQGQPLSEIVEILPPPTLVKNAILDGLELNGTKRAA